MPIRDALKVSAELRLEARRANASSGSTPAPVRMVWQVSTGGNESGRCFWLGGDSRSGKSTLCKMIGANQPVELADGDPVAPIRFVKSGALDSDPQHRSDADFARITPDGYIGGAKADVSTILAGQRE